MLSGSLLEVMCDSEAQAHDLQCQEEQQILLKDCAVFPTWVA